MITHKFYLTADSNRCFKMLITVCKMMGYVSSNNLITKKIKAKLKLPKGNQYQYRKFIPCQFNVIKTDGGECCICMAISDKVDIQVQNLLVYYVQSNIIKKFNGKYYNLNDESGKPLSQPNKAENKNSKSGERQKKSNASSIKSDDVINALLAVIQIIFIILLIPIAIILKAAGIDIKMPKTKTKTKTSTWKQRDHSYHFDEDRDMHYVDEDGYCSECDEYEEDML